MEAQQQHLLSERLNNLLARDFLLQKKLYGHFHDASPA